jgi:hypothetical protein
VKPRDEKKRQRTSVNHILLLKVSGPEARTIDHLAEGCNEEGNKRVAVANERRYREFLMCCCSHNRRGSSARIVTNGHLRNLVPYRIGLLYTANSMGGKGGAETGKKEIRPQDIHISKEKAPEPSKRNRGKPVK